MVSAKCTALNVSQWDRDFTVAPRSEKASQKQHTLKQACLPLREQVDFTLQMRTLRPRSEVPWVRVLALNEGGLSWSVLPVPHPHVASDHCE